MATHSHTLAWKIPWTEEPGRLQFMGSLRVGHDWATSLSRIGEGNGNPLQCSCLENPRDGGGGWAAVYGVAQSRTQLKWLSSSSSSSRLWPTRLLCPWNSPGKNTGMGSHALLQGIFLMEGSNPGLLYCRQILYCLSHQGSPILCNVACQLPPFMRLSRQEYWSGFPCLPPVDLLDPEIEPVSLRSPALAGGFFTTSTSWEAHSATALPVNIQSWFPLRLTGLTSLMSKGFSRVISSTTIQEHQFFGAQPFL